MNSYFCAPSVITGLKFDEIKRNISFYSLLAMHLEKCKEVETTLYLEAFPSKVIAIGNK